MNFDRRRVSQTRTHLITAGILALAPFTAAPAADAPRLGKASVKQVLAAMSLEEKASLVVGEGMWFPPMKNPDGTDVKLPDNIEQAKMAGDTYKLVLGAAGTTFPLPRLGITTSVLTDGPAGLRINATRPGDAGTYYCTAFPVATLLASTWDTNLVAEVGKAMGNEVLEYGSSVLLAPALNIHRNPLCGRNFEYYSEDPVIAGKMAAAMVKGVQSNGVGTSIKHFAANNAETNRNALNVQVSERALREIYLEGFRIAIQDSNPWTVMSSYNKLNGTFASENADLLTKVLRSDWGFQGYVMTDWFAGSDPIAQMKAGNDVIMPGSRKVREAIAQAVRDGKLDVKVLDRNVERILTVLAQDPRAKGYTYSNKPDLKAHAQVTRQAASEGMVLLKNAGGALPLGKEIRKVAAFGTTSYQIITGGTGSGDVNKAYSVPMVDGLQNVGITVNPALKSLYTSYISLVKEGQPKNLPWFMGEPSVGEMDVTPELAHSMAELSDAAIVTIGRNSGEGMDRRNVEGDFLLSVNERALLQHVTEAFHAKHKKVVVVLNIGGSIETASWRELPDAILLAWQGGQETGNSVADILCGKVNPSGKLATTFVMKYEDVPSAKSFPGHEISKAADNGGLGFGEARPAEDTYADGIYVGYRYYDTFNVPTAYEFGYGLSYTTFTYGPARVSSPAFKEQVTVSVDVANSGKAAGREVVQLYLAAPATQLDKPAKELKAFAKTKLLAPGEHETLTFTLDARSLASFDPARSAWVAEAGAYQVKLGASSRDIRGTATFTLAKDRVVKVESKALVPLAPIQELKAPVRK